MIGKKTLQQKSFYGISLEQLVPEDNFYRRLDAELNLDFIYPLVNTITEVRDSARCPLRESCCGIRTKFKKIDDSIHKELFDKMHKKLKANPEYAKRMSKIRSRTVEPVLGTLLNFMGMKRVNTRGIKGAEKHVLMAALCYNLKKYMAFVRKKRITKPAVMIREHAASYFKNRSDLVKRILMRNAPLIFGY